MSQILHSILNQTIPSRVIIADNHPEDESECAFPDELRQHVHDVFRWTVNAGASCRFTPAYATNDCEWTIFHDDDIVCQPRTFESLLKYAGELGNVATISLRGQDVIRHQDGVILNKRVVRSGNVDMVDVTNNIHLVKTKHLAYVQLFKWELIENFGYHQCLFHDDLLLSFAIQKHTGYRSWVIPYRLPKSRIHMRIGPNPHAMSAQLGHLKVRNDFVNMAIQLGWKPKIPVQNW